MSNTLQIALTRLLEYISTINSVLQNFDPYDHYVLFNSVDLVTSSHCTPGRCPFSNNDGVRTLYQHNVSVAVKST